MSKAFETLVLIGRGFGIVFRSNPVLSIIVLVLSVIAALEPAASLWLMKLIIDRLAGITTTGEIPLFSLWTRSAELTNLLLLIGLQLILWIGRDLLNAWESILGSKMRTGFERYTQELIMLKCAELDLAFFEDSRNLDRLDKVRRGASMSAWNLMWMIFYLFGAIITLLSFLIILAQLSWVVPLIVALTTAPQMIASAHYSRKRWLLFTEDTPESRLRHHLSWLVSSADWAKEIKLFGISEYLRSRYKHFAEKYDDLEYQLLKRSSIVNFWLGSISKFATAGIWAYIGVAAFGRLISPGDAILYFRATNNCSGNLLELFSGGGRLYEHMLFLGDFFQLMDLKPESVLGALSLNDGSGRRWGESIAPVKLERGVEFEDVSFSYPGDDKKVLDGVSFSLPARGSVAIVGKNGAGKTTLVKLLVRLYDPTTGEIKLDGENLRNFEIKNLRSSFGVVFQDFSRFYLTLRENIGFGDIDRLSDQERIEWAARQVGVDEMAEKFPLGYETYLSRHFSTEGEELSVGQWQKVALARGLMRDCPIVVLDEPTASLDAFGEYETYKMFEEMTEDRLSVLISHRFSTVRMAQIILVLDEGKIVERGSHEQLMKADGLYASMFSTQAERYK